MLEEIIQEAINRQASDIHLVKDCSPVLRIDGELYVLEQFQPLTSKTLEELACELLKDSYEEYLKHKSHDFSLEVGHQRFRAHVFRASESSAFALRLIPSKIPDVSSLNLPQVVHRFTQLERGLVLVTGTTGSGKSTTLAALINEINKTQKKHIITVEDPIEFIYEKGLSIISQREAGEDVLSFSDAVRAAMREDPDILLVGEMRDLETIQNTITMAETGHLVFATLHTKNAPESINRIIDIFPPNQQQQIRLELSAVLEGVISQILLPKNGGGRVPACEVLIATDSIRSLIRDQGVPNAIYDQIQLNHKKLGSQTLEQSLADLYTRKLITYETALKHTNNAEILKRMIQAGV